MSRSKFLRELKRFCRKNDLVYDWQPDEGKGSHGTVYVSGRKATIPDRDLPRFFIDDLLEQLGLGRDAV